MHTVNRYLIFLLWHRSFHQTDFIHLFTCLKNTHRSLRIIFFQNRGCFFVKILIKSYILLFFYLFHHRIVCFFFKLHMSVFDVIFFKTFIICYDHTVSCYKKSGNKSDRQCHKQKYDNILWKFSDQFSRQAFYQWIFHLPALLPVKIYCGNLLLITIILPYLSVAQLNDTIRHIFDGIVMGYHYDRIPVFVIDFFNQIQNIFGRIIIQCSGRLIAQKNIRIFYNRTSDRGTLLLSTGKLIWQFMTMFIQPKCL